METSEERFIDKLLKEGKPNRIAIRLHVDSVHARHFGNWGRDGRYRSR
jgi:hypothetical protein